jgi:hypothetical protein
VGLGFVETRNATARLPVSGVAAPDRGGLEVAAKKLRKRALKWRKSLARVNLCASRMRAAGAPPSTHLLSGFAASVGDADAVHSAAARAGMASRGVQPSPPNPRPTQT